VCVPSFLDCSYVVMFSAPGRYVDLWCSSESCVRCRRMLVDGHS
jgi:hypothetical protein